MRAERKSTRFVSRKYAPTTHQTGSGFWDPRGIRISKKKLSTSPRDDTNRFEQKLEYFSLIAAYTGILVLIIFCILLICSANRELFFTQNVWMLILALMLWWCGSLAENCKLKIELSKFNKPARSVTGPAKFSIEHLPSLHLE
jgi:hypothetical protein